MVHYFKFIFILAISSTFLISGVSCKKYYLNRIARLNWFSAFQDCQARGMQLASIESPHEQNELEKMLRDNNVVDKWFWTSGTDQATEGKFVWMSTGNPFGFTKWEPNEPNNDKKVEHCVTVWSFKDRGALWNDVDCGGHLYYICEEKTDCTVQETVVNAEPGKKISVN